MKQRLMPAVEYGTSGVTAWIQDNIVSLILLVLAVVMLWAGKQGNVSKIVTIAGCTLIGLVFLGIAVGDGTAVSIAKWILSLFTG